MLTSDAKEYIRFCLGDLLTKPEIDEGIVKLDQYLDYIFCTHHNSFGNVINDFSVSSPMQQRNQLKSFLDIELYLGQLADELNLIDPNNLTPLPSDTRRGNTNLELTLERYYKQAFQLFSDNFSLSSESAPINNNNRNRNGHEYHFLNLYYYRNKIGDHFNSGNSISDLSAENMNGLIKSMLFVMIYLAKKYDNDLQKKYAISNQNLVIKAFDTQRYANDIRSNYESNRSFEYLDTRWDIDISKSNGMTIKEIISENYSNLIIAFIGEAGIGKTTALRRLEYEYAKKCSKNGFKKLPIYIELKNLRPSDSALKREIITRLNMTDDSAETVIKTEALVLLLDGFNEIADKQFAGAIRSEVEDILASNDKLLIFITDRNNKHTQFKAIQSPWYCYLHELSLDEKNEFFKANCKYTTSLDIINQQINEELQNGAPPIIQFLRTPYMLSVFLSYVDEFNSIPDDPISNYIERLFEREEKEQKDSDDPKHFEQMKNSLGALAYKFDNNEFRRIDAQTTIATVKKLFAYQTLDSSECIELSIKMGLLERIDENTLQFMSKEFCDYFGTYALATGIADHF